MAGWNGAGIFILPYSMVAEAAAGVKILASHQDTQWNAVKTGLEHCVTIDGQTSPAGDIPWNNHRITLLGSPVVATDATNKSYVDSVAANEWVPEAFSVTWINATTVKVNGTDATGRYTPGRRVKVLHNTGASTAYATVISSTFSVDTTVVLTVDAGTALLSTVTALSYGELGYVNPSSLDPRTAVMAYVTTGYSTSSSPETIALNAKTTDSNGEFSTATGKFTCRYPGNYQISGQITAKGPSNATVIMQYQVIKNGAVSLFFGQVVYAPGSEGTNPLPMPIPTIVATLAKGDTIELVMFNGSLGMQVSGAIAGPFTYMSIVRIP